MEHIELVCQLERLVSETYHLWDPGWVTFNWRGYTYDHVQRVTGLARELGSRAGADLRVLELASLLHDITKPYDGEYLLDASGKRLVDAQGHWHNAVRLPTRHNRVTALYERLGLQGQLHNVSGAILAGALLSDYGLDAHLCARVSETITQHLHPAEDAPLESLCLYDADTLDANIGLPAFVRNIYINLHFYDARKAPEAPPLDAMLRDGAEGYLRSYVTEKLPPWSEGKRRDFLPRMRTGAARDMALARLERMAQTWDRLSQELHDWPTNSRQGCLAVVLHFMCHRDDPSIAEETAYLAERWLTMNGALPQARAFIAQLRREAAGRE